MRAWARSLLGEGESDEAVRRSYVQLAADRFEEVVSTSNAADNLFVLHSILSKHMELKADLLDEIGRKADLLDELYMRGKVRPFHLSNEKERWRYDFISSLGSEFENYFRLMSNLQKEREYCMDRDTTYLSQKGRGRDVNS